MLGKCFHRDRKANLELKALRCQLVGTDFGSARSSWIQSSLQCHGHDWVSSTKLGNSKAKKWKCPFGHPARYAQTPQWCVLWVSAVSQAALDSRSCTSTVQLLPACCIESCELGCGPARAGFPMGCTPAPPVSAQPAQGGSLPFCDLLFSFLACVWLYLLILNSF